MTTLENPAPVHVLDDLVSLVDPERMQVSRVDGDKVTDCPFAHAAPAERRPRLGPGASPAIASSAPAAASSARASSRTSTTARTGASTRRRRAAAGASLRIRFLGVRFGQTLHGHHGLYVEAERNKTGAPVTITFRVGDRIVGSVVHHDGDGWKPFEFDTSELAAGAQTPRRRQRGRRSVDLVAEIGSPSGDRRMYCFEADTR